MSSITKEGELTPHFLNGHVERSKLSSDVLGNPALSPSTRLLLEAIVYRQLVNRDDGLLDQGLPDYAPHLMAKYRLPRDGRSDFMWIELIRTVIDLYTGMAVCIGKKNGKVL